MRLNIIKTKQKKPIKNWAGDLNMDISPKRTDGQQAHEKMFHTDNKEMQIKTTMRYHFTPARMAIVKKSTNNKCWKGCGEKGIPLYC